MKRTKAELEAELARLQGALASARSASEGAEPYRTLVESSPDAIFVVGKDGRVRYANAASGGLLERPTDEIVGTPLADLFPPDVAIHEQKAVERVLKDGEPQTSEMLMSFPSGPVWQHVSLVPIKDANGEFTSAFGVARDITELKRAEEGVLASEARYRALVEAVGDIVFVIGRDDLVQYVNTGAARWLRSTPEELIGKSRAALFPEDTEWGKTQAANLRSVLESGQSYYVENVARFPEGSRWQGTSLAPVRDAEGNVVAVLGIGRDVTNRKQAEESLSATNDELQSRLRENERLSSQVSALNRMGQMLLGCREVEEVCEVFSSFAAELFPATSGGLAMREHSGGSIVMVAEWGDSVALDRVFDADDCWALRLGHPHFAEKGRVSESHVSMDDVHSSLCVPLAAQGHTRGVLTLVSQGDVDLHDDILQQHAMSVAEQMALAFASVTLRNELESQAVHDPLTRLYNRRFLDEALSRELLRAARSGESVAVIMFDVDYFKRFNDEFGHAAGDEVLCALAHAAQDASRGSDIACRFGGDEMVLVLPGATVSEAVVRAEQIRKRINGRSLVGSGAGLPPLTMSAGVAAYPANGNQPEEVLGAADDALYRAKAAGRDRVETA